MVNRLHGEIEGHELDDGPQARHRRADGHAREAMFGDRRIDDAARSEFLQQALGDLVGALIFGDLFAHDEDIAVAAHFFGHGVAQRFANGGHHHRRAGWNFSHGGCRGDGGGHGGHEGSRGGRLDMRCGSGRRHRRGVGRFALFHDHADHRVDGDIIRTVRHDDLAKQTLIDRLDLHGRLVGLDLGDDVAGLDAVAFLLQPFRKLALLHGRRQRGHEDIGGHGGPHRWGSRPRVHSSERRARKRARGFMRFKA